MSVALVIDDHPVTHIGCAQILRDAGFSEILAAHSGEEGHRLARARRPALVILDLGLPDMNGQSLIAPLLRSVPEARILVLSMNDRLPFARGCIQAGAHGYVSKTDPPDEIREAVEAVARGETWLPRRLATALAVRALGGGADPVSTLTEREVQVVQMLGQGRDLQSIADALGVSYKTVANASAAAKRKLGLSGTSDLIRFAISEGLC